MRLRLACAVALLLAQSAPAAWNPEGWQAKAPPVPEFQTNPGAIALTALLTFYRTRLSPIDASNCPSYPSCSAYAVQAVARYGFWGGGALTASRLLSEADEAAFSKRVPVGGQLKVWYPLEETLLPGGQSNGR